MRIEREGATDLAVMYSNIVKVVFVLMTVTIIVRCSL